MPRYITEGPVQPYGWGRAFVDYVFPAAPSAGANKAVVVGGENWFRVLAARATLTTDSNAANRLLCLDFINARSTTILRNGASVLVTASTTNQAFEWQYTRTVAEWNTGTPVFLPVVPIFLDPGSTVQFTVDSIQVGDTLTNLSLVLERWPTGPRGEQVADRAEQTQAGY